MPKEQVITREHPLSPPKFPWPVQAPGACACAAWSSRGGFDHTEGEGDPLAGGGDGAIQRDVEIHSRHAPIGG